MRSVIHKKSIITLIAAILLSPVLIYFTAYADEDTPVTYSTPLLPGVTDYQVDGDVTLDVNVAAVNALEITLSTTRIALELVPGMVESGFDSKDLTIKVGTTNDTGYTLTMIPSYENTSTTNLTRTEAINNTTPVIETITNSVSAETFSSTADTTTINRWGYKLGETNLDVNKTLYNPVQITNEINNSTTAISNDQTTISFAAKASNELPAGNYRTTLKFTAVANPTVYYYMQDYNYTTMATLLPNVGDKVKMIDVRDGQEYWVGKAADNNYWMLQNLKLGLKASTYNLTSANSDVSGAGFRLSGRLADGHFTGGVVDGWEDQNNSSQYYCTLAYGCYYNWYSATAGTGTTAVASGNAINSICPKGWVLPTGGNNGQFHVLSTAYDDNMAGGLVVSNPTVTTDNVDGQVPGLLLGGVYTVNGLLSAGSFGGYWSRSAFNNRYSYDLDLYATNVGVSGIIPKMTGMAVRCLADARTIADVTTMQDVTSAMVANTAVGTTATLKDSRTGTSYGIKLLSLNGVKTLWMTDELALPGGTTLVPASSNVSVNYTLPNDTGASGWAEDYCKPYMAFADGKYYYNFAAATARTNATSSIDASVGCTNDMDNSVGDICPAGWRLPSYIGEVNQPQWLSDMKSSGTLTTTGRFINGAVSAFDKQNWGFWHTSYRADDTSIWSLHYDVRDDTVRGDHHVKSYGYSVRCMKTS